MIRCRFPFVVLVVLAAILLGSLVLPVMAVNNTDLSATCPAAGTAAMGTGIITGTVTAADTTQPLAGASVSAIGPTYRTTLTDSMGKYRLENLAPGNYTILFEPSQTLAARYAAEYYNDKPTISSAASIAVTNGTTINMIDAALDVGGKITGRVTAADIGSVLPQITANIYTSDNHIIRVRTVTNSNGEYTSPALKTGDYKILFQPPDSGYVADYVPQVYNNRPESDLYMRADLIHVSGPTITTNINATLTKGGRITGTVTGVDTQAGVEGVRIRVQDIDKGSYYFARDTRAAGTYTVTGLPSGNYHITFETSNVTSGAGSKYIPQVYNTVIVAAPNTTANINATLQIGGQIAGRVTKPDGSPASFAEVSIYDSAGNFVSSEYTMATGYYTTTGLASGSYGVKFDDYRYALQYFNNKPDRMSADQVNVTAPNILPNINAMLNIGGCVSGQVTSAHRGAGLAGVSVYVYNSVDEIVASATTDATGNYSTSGVLNSGNYRIAIFDSISRAFIYFNNKPDLAHADPINVASPNPTGGINLMIGGTAITMYLPFVQR